MIFFKILNIVSCSQASIIWHNIGCFIVSSIISGIGYSLSCLWWFYQNFFPVVALLWFYLMRRHESYLKNQYFLIKKLSDALPYSLYWRTSAAKLLRELHRFQSVFYTYCWVILAFSVFLSVANYCINELGILNNLPSVGRFVTYSFNCHLFPPVTYPNPYQGCYVNFNSLEGSSLISSFKLKSYPYMVFGGVEPYTTSLTVKVPFFVSDSKLFILLEKIF